MGLHPFIGSGKLLPPAGYIAWYDASQLTPQGDGTNLSNWPDLSGNGYNLTPIGTNPHYRTPANGINGLSIVQTNGGGMATTTPAPTQAQPITVFLVAQLTSAVNGRDLFGGNTSAGHFDMFDNSPDFNIGGGSAFLGTVAADTALHCFIGKWDDPSNTSFQVDGHTDTGSIGTGSINAIAISGDPSGSHGTSIGKFCECIVYPNITVSSSALRTYAQHKWGTP